MFRRVIWKGVKELGVGMAVSRSGMVFVVADYWPGGDMKGELPVDDLSKIIQKSVEEDSEIKEDSEETETVMESLEIFLRSFNQIQIKKGAKPLVLDEKVNFSFS